jgi:Inner membrane component domain
MTMSYHCPRCTGPIQSGQAFCPGCALPLDPASLSNYEQARVAGQVSEYAQAYPITPAQTQVLPPMPQPSTPYSTPPPAYTPVVQPTYAAPVYQQPVYAAPPPPVYMPQIVQQVNVIQQVSAVQQSVSRPVYYVNHGPSMAVCVTYFLFVGWWVGLMWLSLAITLMCTIIGIPLGILMLRYLPQVTFLRSL